MTVACEQQTHFRQFSPSKKHFQRERIDDRKCVCCSQARMTVVIQYYSCIDCILFFSTIGARDLNLYRKSSIKPPGGLFFPSTFDGEA